MTLLSSNGRLLAFGGRLLSFSGGMATTTPTTPATTSPSTPTATSGPPVTSTAPSDVLTRYDVLLDQSAAAPGASVSGRIVPNGKWPASSDKTITLTPANGSAVTMTMPASGSDPLPFSVTAGNGELSYAASNTAGLYDPYPAPLTAFASSSGTAQTIAAKLTRSDMVTYQRDTASGAPTGFGSQWTRGWGEVWVNIGSIGGSTGGLFVRLYDAQSSGASATVGTGTQLTSGAVQVYGSVSGSGTVRVLLPASASIYWMDIATDAAFTNPVRVAQRFRVGVVLAYFGRSQETGTARAFAYSGTNNPLPTMYAKAASWVAFDPRYSNTDSGWFVHDGVSADPYQYHYGEASSSGTMELGRLVEAHLGVCVGVTGIAASGYDFDTWVNHDGSSAYPFDDTVNAAVGRKFRYLTTNHAGWSGSDAYPTQTHDEVRTRIIASCDWFLRKNPSLAVIGWNQAASGWFGDDGSADTGYTRNQMVVLNELETSNPAIVSKESILWNEFNTNHATMAARLDYIRPGFRMLMAAERTEMGGFQTRSRGPRMASTGSYDAATRTISIGYTLGADATELRAVGATYSSPSTTFDTASPAELAGLFSVYAGPNGRRNAVLPILLASASINAGSKTIQVVLGGSSGVSYVDTSTNPPTITHSDTVPSSFTAHFAADFRVSMQSLSFDRRGVMLADDRVGNLGIPYGWHMRPALDIQVS